VTLKSVNIKIIVLQCFLLKFVVISSVVCDLKFAPPLNEKPTASFTATQQAGSYIVDFDASASSDNDANDNGIIIKYEWNFGDGKEDEGVKISHNYDIPGIFFVRLKVTDDDDATHSDEQYVRVSWINKTPKAVLVLNANNESTDFTWVFDGSGSSDEDGSIVRYRFIIIRRSDQREVASQDGDSPTMERLIEEYMLGGQKQTKFKVTLDVWDDQDATHQTEKSFEVYAKEKGSDSIF